MDLIFVAIQNTPGIFKLADAQIAISPTAESTFTVTLHQNSRYVLKLPVHNGYFYFFSEKKTLFFSAKNEIPKNQT